MKRGYLLTLSFDIQIKLQVNTLFVERILFYNEVLLQQCILSHPIRLLDYLTFSFLT